MREATLVTRTLAGRIWEPVWVCSRAVLPQGGEDGCQLHGCFRPRNFPFFRSDVDVFKRPSSLTNSISRKQREIRIFERLARNGVLFATMAERQSYCRTSGSYLTKGRGLPSPCKGRKDGLRHPPSPFSPCASDHTCSSKPHGSKHTFLRTSLRHWPSPIYACSVNLQSD